MKRIESLSCVCGDFWATCWSASMLATHSSEILACRRSLVSGRLITDKSCPLLLRYLPSYPTAYRD